MPHLENHAQYTCLRVAEVVIFEVELSDRWVVGFQLGHWDATELQRLALLLSNMTSPMEKHINYKETNSAYYCHVGQLGRYLAFDVRIASKIDALDS